MGVRLAQLELHVHEPQAVVALRHLRPAVNVRSWGANNGKDRITIIGGNHYYSGNPFPTRVNVTDTGIVTAAPPVGAPSPAELWRRAHPYDSWAYAIR